MAEPDSGAEIQMEDGTWHRLSEELNHDPANSRKMQAAMEELQLDAAHARRDYLLSRTEEEENDDLFADFTAAMMQAAKED